MCKNLFLLLMVIAFFGGAGCSGNDEANTQSVPEQVQVRAPAIEALKKNMNSQQSLLINKQKFQVASLPILAGDEVYDTRLRQPAIVKNEIVVVTDKAESDVLGKYLKEHGVSVSTKRLASTVIAIYFANKKTDLYSHYQQLEALPGVKQVEMQFNYSPTTDKALATM